LHWSVLSETRRQRVLRQRAVVRLVFEVFRVAVRHLGEERARDLLRNMSARGRGRPTGSADPDFDHELLAAYDSYPEKLTPHRRRALPGLVAREHATVMSGRMAIESRLRRLLDQREAERSTAEAFRGEMRRLVSAQPGASTDWPERVMRTA